MTWRYQPLLPQSHLDFIFPAEDLSVPSQHCLWDPSTWAGRLQGSTGQGPAISWLHFDRGQSLTFQLHLKINTWLLNDATTLPGFPPLRALWSQQPHRCTPAPQQAPLGVDEGLGTACSPHQPPRSDCWTHFPPREYFLVRPNL